MVHTALQTKTLLAHAHCEVEQAKRSDSVNIGDGCSISWVKGRIRKNGARGHELPPHPHIMGSHHKQMVKGKLKAVHAEDPRHVRNVETRLQTPLFTAKDRAKYPVPRSACFVPP